MSIKIKELKAIHITDGKTVDNKGAHDIPLLKGSVIVADRFYNDLSLLSVWDSNGVNFVVRHKDNLAFRSVRELELPVKHHQHLLKDELIELTGKASREKYPKRLRRVAIWDDANQQAIEVVTNNMHWAASTIADLYKARWQVEIFFREINRLLHI